MTLTDSLETAPTLDAALGLVVSALHADGGTIHVLGPDGMLHLRAATDDIPAHVRELVQVVPVGKGMAGTTVARNAPLNLRDLELDRSGVVKPGARETHLEGAVVAPMRKDGKAVGALGVGNLTERTFTDQEVALLLAAGEVLARRFA